MFVCMHVWEISEICFASFLQDDKDLVHEFVSSDGLNALISVGQDADQNHQNYILRGEAFQRVMQVFLPQSFEMGTKQHENYGTINLFSNDILITAQVLLPIKISVTLSLTSSKSTLSQP